MYVPYHIDLSVIPVQESSQQVKQHCTTHTNEMKIFVRYSVEYCIAEICTMFMFFSFKYEIFFRASHSHILLVMCRAGAYNPLQPNNKYLWKILQCLQVHHKYLW